MSFPYIPKELVNIILEFDGQIKYRRGEYVNIIHKYDTRYKIIEPVINNKMKILKKYLYLASNRIGFNFSVKFHIPDRLVTLCYDYNLSYPDKFGIFFYAIDVNGIFIQYTTWI